MRVKVISGRRRTTELLNPATQTEEERERQTERQKCPTYRFSEGEFSLNQHTHHEEMSFEIIYIRVMKNSRTAWIALTGVLLTASVCDAECIKHNFKEHITDHLLVDHWFQMKSFTPPGEEVTLQHEFLSVLNTVCSSLIANQQFISADPLNGKTQSRVVWTYIQMIKELAVDGRGWSKNDTVQFCFKTSCSEFYSTSFINSSQFQRIYRKVCVWNTTVAASCPPQHHVHLQSSSGLTDADLQSSSGLTDGSSSRQSESQCVSSGLLVSTVVLLIIIVIIILLIYFRVKASRSPKYPQESVTVELSLLPNANTANTKQVQGHVELHEEDMGAQTQ